MSSNTLMCLSLTFLVAASALTGCNQPSDTATAPAAEPTTSEQTQTETHNHDHTHDHHHHDAETYTCDNGKPMMLAIHNHEGEMEAHATIDDITYDLHPDTAVANQYISHEEGINSQGMTITLTDNQAVVTSLADNSVLLTCQK